MTNEADVAYLVIAHDDLVSLSFLLDRLSGRKIYLCIPAKSPLSKVEITHPSSPTVLRTSSQAHWAGFSVVRCTIEALEFITVQEGPDCQIVMLSGTCVPVKPIEDFERWIYSSPQRIIANIAKLDDRSSSWSLTHKRISRFYLFDFGFGFLEKITSGVLSKAIRKVSRTVYLPRPSFGKRRPPTYIGSQWMSYPVSVANDIVAAYKSGWFQRFVGTFAPDESAIQTFLSSTKYSNMLRSPLVESELVDELLSVAALANYHYLRTDMAGFLSLEEIHIAGRSPYYFARKVQPLSSTSMQEELTRMTARN